MYKKIIILLTCVILTTTAYALNSKVDKDKVQNKSLAKLKEFHERNGLPNLFWKIRHSRQVRIAYLGGSITAASDGWRNLTFDWFRLNFPETSFYLINGGIGGTGSDLGVFRLERDILSKNPDLIFVEFAVNDGGKDRENILRTIEGIIRKIGESNPYADICFVYTVDEKQFLELVNGRISRSVQAMEELAEYYGIPSIHMGMKVVELYHQGKLIFTASPDENERKIVFTKDHVHPLAESGHPIYGAVVCNSLDKMKSRTASVARVLPKPYIEDNWQLGTLVKISDTKIAGDWEKLRKGKDFSSHFFDCLPEIYKGKPGSSLKFNFEGSVLGVYDIVGPQTGNIELSIDGEKIELNRFDKYCSHYRLAYKFVPIQLENTNHTVELRISEDVFDKSKVLIGDHLDDFRKNRERYSGYDYIIGNFMIIGKLIKD